MSKRKIFLTIESIFNASEIDLEIGKELIIKNNKH